MISSPEDTIVALATPPGRAAIALLRLSGPRAHALTLERFEPREAAELRSRRPRLGHFLNRKGGITDQVMVTLFQAPASYTGEDMVEISCHGSPAIARQLIDELLYLGARLAEPGEFTLRAFLNSKLDLAQAEAVRDLVESQSAFQAKLAAEQLQGKLSRRLQPLRQELVEALCHMETSLEFVEDAVEPRAREALLEALCGVDDELARMESGFPLGRLVQEGVTAVLAGRPNTGKSSLFNRLLDDERAIVTTLPGTTRDALTETVGWGGLLVRLVDTAGIRETEEVVERLGVEKSREHLRGCQLCLFVVDGSQPFGDQDRRAWEALRDKTYLLVINKADLPQKICVPSKVQAASAASVAVSAKHGTGLEELRAALVGVATDGGDLEGEGLVVTNARHQGCLREARRHLQKGLRAYQGGMSEEFPAYDFRNALAALGQITGETTTEDILGQIFGTFCIGK